MSILLLGGSKVVAGAAYVAPDWEVVRNFNSGTVGTGTQGQADGFDDAAGGSTYSTEQSFEGGKSAKLTIASGVSGFGAWGGIINFPSNVVKGDTLWLQQYIYLPSAFNLTTNNTSLKYIRIAQRTAAHTQTGFFDLQLRDASVMGSDFRMLKEGQAVWENFGADGVVVRDTWMRHTLCMTFDDVLPGSGGSSRIRFWQDGVKLVDSATTKTIINATDYAHGYYLFTYWNGNSPIDNACYVDDIRIAKNGVPSWVLDLEGVG